MSVLIIVLAIIIYLNVGYIVGAFLFDAYLSSYKTTKKMILFPISSYRLKKGLPLTKDWRPIIAYTIENDHDKNMYCFSISFFWPLNVLYLLVCWSFLGLYYLLWRLWILKAPLMGIAFLIEKLIAIIFYPAKKIAQKL